MCYRIVEFSKNFQSLWIQVWNRVSLYQRMFAHLKPVLFLFHRWLSSKTGLWLYQCYCCVTATDFTNPLSFSSNGIPSLKSYLHRQERKVLQRTYIMIESNDGLCFKSRFPFCSCFKEKKIDFFHASEKVGDRIPIISSFLFLFNEWVFFHDLFLNLLNISFGNDLRQPIAPNVWTSWFHSLRFQAMTMTQESSSSSRTFPDTGTTIRDERLKASSSIGSGDNRQQQIRPSPKRTVSLSYPSATNSPLTSSLSSRSGRRLLTLSSGSGGGTKTVTFAPEDFYSWFPPGISPSQVSSLCVFPAYCLQLLFFSTNELTGRGRKKGEEKDGRGRKKQKHQFST